MDWLLEALRVQHNRVILIGAGHAHLHLAKQAKAFACRGVDLVLIDPGAFWYSGLATGMLGGEYEKEDDTLDPAALISTHGGRAVRARLARMDRAARCVCFDNGTTLHYDLLSFNIGSEVDLPSGLIGQPDIVPVKPIANLWDLRQRLRARWREGCATTRICIIGGGATGCEIAANLQALASRQDADLDLTLISSESRLLPQWPASAAHGLARALQRRGIRLLFECRVEAARDHALRTSDGARHPYDFAVAALGLRAPALLNELALPIAGNGGLRVDASLRVAGDERIFGAGDCIHFDDRELPRLGVFGVREAPVLLTNLLAALDGVPLRTYKPQRRYLSILNLGDGTGLALRGRLHWRGRASLWLKTRLDQKFLNRFKAACLSKT